MKLALLLCTFQILVATCSRFDGHAAIQSANGDYTSQPYKAKLRIYCNKTGRWLRIKKKRIDANGGREDPNVLMELVSINFQGIVAIRKWETNRYLCMDSSGKLIAKRKRNITNARGCQFKHSLNPSYFDIFLNRRYPKWVIAFRSNGKPKKGPNTSASKQEAYLMIKRVENSKPLPAPTVGAQSNRDRIFHRVIWPESKRSMQGDDPRVFQDQDSLGISQENDTKFPKLPHDLQEELKKRREMLQDRKTLPTALSGLPSSIFDNSLIQTKQSSIRHRTKTRKNKRKEKRRKIKASDVINKGDDVKAKKLSIDDLERKKDLVDSSVVTPPAFSLTREPKKLRRKTVNQGTKARSRGTTNLRKNRRNRSRHRNGKIT